MYIISRRARRAARLQRQRFFKVFWKLIFFIIVVLALASLFFPSIIQEPVLPQLALIPQVSVTVAEVQTTPEVLQKSAKAKFDNVLVLVNEQRVAKGLSTLQYNNRIAAGAQTRASRLNSTGQWSHNGLAQALWNAGLRDWYSENLARNFNSDAEVVQGWVASPEHAAKMFDARCTQGGVGRAGNVIVLWMGICGQPK